MAAEETGCLLEQYAAGDPQAFDMKVQEAEPDRCGATERSPRSVFFIFLSGVVALGLGLIRMGSSGRDSAAGGLMLAVGDTASLSNTSTLTGYISNASHTRDNMAEHMSVELCKTPYITKNASTLRAMEARQITWLHNMLDVAKARQAQPGRGWDVFNDIMMPVLPEACVTERIGSPGDGGKHVCGLENLAGRKDCVVYSIGSNNQWDFEEAIVMHTGCRVETFDCTVTHATIPPAIQDHVHFEPLCLGTLQSVEAGVKVYRAPSNSSTGVDLTTMKQLRNTSDISLLKMDVEGAEWDALRAMLRNDWEALPEQISIELHLWHIEPMEVATFAQQLHMAGYRAVSKEDNPMGECCTEYTLVRVYCPFTNPF